MAGFDDIVTTDAEREALERLRSATGEADGPMERHCARCRHIAARVAGERHWVIDGEVLTVAAILHDIGLYPPYAGRERAYVADGAALARELLPAFGWSAERVQRCSEAIERHHEVRPQLGRGPEVEALRLADRVEVTGGLMTAGLPRAWLRGVFASVPRTGFYRELTRLLGPEMRRRPTGLPRILWRG